MGDNYYCGMGPVSKGKVRAPPEYCLKNNQVRYYGIVAIDPELLKSVKSKTSSLVKEQLRLKKIEDDAKILIKEVKNLKIILDDDKARPSVQKKAQKRMDELLVKRDRLVKRLKAQKSVVEAAEEEEKEREKEAASLEKKKKSKSGSKSRKKSK